MGYSSVFLLSLLSCAFHPLLGFSLKNCTVAYCEAPNTVWVSCSSHELTAVPDDIPRDATSLNLNSNHIIKFASTDFRGLSKMASIQACDNEISHIDDRAFTDLTELTLLSLDQNKLVNLTDNMFQGLSKLLTLSLLKNQISHISPKAFESLVSIRRVNLGFNQLHQVSHIAPIVQLPTSHVLILPNNKFTSFESDDLSLNPSSVRTLQIAANPLGKISITKNIFPHLQSLDFSLCAGTIEWDVTNKTYLRNLTDLYFSGNDISFGTGRKVLQTAGSLQKLTLYFMKTYVKAGLLNVACQIPSLRMLDVTQSKMGILEENMLQSCSRLSELFLSNNDLTELPENSLKPLTQLRFLALTNNQLYKVPRELRRLSELEILYLNINLISALNCHDFQNMTRLKHLYLSRNRISALKHCVFQHLKSLIVLDIGDNAVFALDKTFGVHLQKLEFLSLHNSGPFMFYGGDFRNLSSLRVLDLESGTFFYVGQGAFKGLDNLQTLSLSLDLTDDVFKGLRHLEKLTLHLTWNWRSSQQNDLHKPLFSNLPFLKKLVLKVYDRYQIQISPDLLKGLVSLEYFSSDKFFKTSLHPDTFMYSPKLRSLQILHSNLSHLDPELFRPTPNLKALDLSNNNFRCLDFLARANLTALEQLKLSENKLSVVNETVLQSLPALKYLDLTNNPLTCECSNLGFNIWALTTQQTQVVNAHQYGCAFPVSQQGNKLLDFDVKSYRVDVSFTCFVTSTSVIVFTLLACFMYHFLRLHLVYAYYLFLTFLYDKTRRRTRAAYQFDAFVSYNVHDEDWVYRELLPELEGQQGWKLCLHHRDFEPGKPILENITDAIYGSRKTICVISRHYLQSEWCSREIHMASFRLFDEQEDVLVLLFLENIPNQQLSLYHRMRSLVKRCTYLSWPMAGGHTGVFWANVQRALVTAEPPAEHMDTSLLEIHA